MPQLGKLKPVKVRKYTRKDGTEAVTDHRRNLPIPSLTRENKSEAAILGWATRRARYGPTGRKYSKNP